MDNCKPAKTELLARYRSVGFSRQVAAAFERELNALMSQGLNRKGRRKLMRKLHARQ